MVNLLFFLKFKSQLRRTRPDLVRQLEESLSRAIVGAGGKITGDRFIISAVFNENSIGFWLDIYILVESIKKRIDTSNEFYGYSLVITSMSPENPELLCRFLANYNGVFVNNNVAKNMIPYLFLENPTVWQKGNGKQKYGSAGFYRIKELKNFIASARNVMQLQNNVTESFEQEENKNTLVLGPAWLPMRSGLYNYCNSLIKDFPPLTICFECTGLGSIIDIWSPGIRLLSDCRQNEEINNLWEFLFHERIRDEVSEYTAGCVKKYLFLIFDYYCNSAYKKNKTPVILLENIHLAENNMMELLLNILTDFEKDSKKILILGTAADDISDDMLVRWKTVFNTVNYIENVKYTNIIPRLSIEFWEIVYIISLFSRYFPPEYFLNLLKDEGKNTVMIIRAFSILFAMGIISSVREPRLMNIHYKEYAEKILDDKTTNIKAIVCRRLLDWIVKRNINPCFRLLLDIGNLGGVKHIDDMLLLQTISSDIFNETTFSIETAINSGQFQKLITARASIIKYIYKTSKALNSGLESEVDKTFAETQENIVNSSNKAFPVLYAQVLVNLSIFYLGRHEEKEAAEKAKEAILLGQYSNSFCLPQAYRLFSLVCFSKQHVNETIEYLGFAHANAERNGNYHELAISGYYTAAVLFLYGDIYNASRLVKKSIEQSLAAGRTDWADRCRFLEGRLEFELGHYDEALNIFEKLRNVPYGSNTEEKDSLFAAWIYRSKIYKGEPALEKPQDANQDADIFEIEAAYISGDYEKAVKLSSVCSNSLCKRNIFFTERADWYSGFAQCEYLFFTQDEIQKRMINLFNSLSLSRLEGQYDEALFIIQELLRDEKLCEIDPLDSFYFFAKYLILEQADANVVDLSTAVSMAFKRLQRRAGRIDDIETRRLYLNNPHWNRILSKIAKDFKLI